MWIVFKMMCLNCDWLKFLSSNDCAQATLGETFITKKEISMWNPDTVSFKRVSPLHSSTPLTSHFLERNDLSETVQFGILEITTVYPVQHPLSRFFICRASTASHSQINRSGAISFIGTQQLHEFLHFILCFHEASHFWETINSRCASVSLVFFTSSNVSKSI